MDNKRTGYWKDIPNDEFYKGYLYMLEKQKRHIYYIDGDITIENPMMRDFKHIYMCYLNDDGYNEKDLENEDLWPNFRSARHKTKWLFDHEKRNETLYVTYKNNEYVGFATAAINHSPPGNKVIAAAIEPDSLVVGTEMFCRKKFRKTKVVVCAYDFFVNFLGENRLCITDNMQLPRMVDIMNGKEKNPDISSLVDRTPMHKKVQAHRILKKLKERDTRRSKRKDDGK